jgi:hypothetical protein
MKKLLLVMHLLFLAALQTFAQDTPLSMNGKLKLVGNQLSNECGSKVQLRGLSTHAIMSHSKCYTAASIKSMAEVWKSDLLRLAVYTADVGQTKGYINGNREEQQDWIDNMVTMAENNGMYVIIDWHILSDGNPMTYVNEAKAFFTLMSNKYKNKRHVIYEICNEPNGGVGWGTIKSYAEQVIPVIRANDPDGIILVGTPDWSSKVWDAANDPLKGSNAHNVMYAFHFYAGSHFDYSYLRSALGKIPIFATEWGTVAASGDGGFNPGSANTWLSILGGDNDGGQLVSNANWSFVDKAESASVLKPDACSLEKWTDRTQEGDYVFNYLTQADKFIKCNAAADDDGDGVPNSSDLCPNTPKGTYVDSKGCPALQGDADNDGIIDAKDLCPNTPAGSTVNMNGCVIEDDFVSNVCMGFNNYQGYARSDFSEDSLINLDFWNRPSVKNPVYSAGTQNNELVIQVTKADPNYATMGFSFGEIYSFNGTSYDTTLLPLDISRHPIVEMKMHFQGTNYSPTTVLVDIQLEDVYGNVVNANNGLVMRKTLELNKWVDVIADFSLGSRESYAASECGGTTPCYITNEFDFTKVNKVKMNVNPGAGEAWSRPEFTGVWKIDDFSVGYDATKTETCTTIRDDDGDGVKQELDKCPNTPPNTSVNAQGCAVFQLDDDGDGVVNPDDACPNTPKGLEVNSRGCAANEGDSDEDGVLDIDDLCSNTPKGESVNASGCSASQINLDDDNDGVVNGSDLCPNTPNGETVDAKGCSNSQKDDDGDGTPNGQDGCPLDPNKTAPGNCGCGVAENACSIDCNGDINGNAYLDKCSTCVGGSTGLEACAGDPYNGVAQVIPGMIQAEYFDLGGQNVAYFDTDNDNHNSPFRSSEYVDMESVFGTNYSISYTVAGEWLEYTVEVLQNGTYQIHFNIASAQGSGAWYLTLDGNTLEGSDKGAKNTGSWTTYELVSTTTPITLQKGKHTLRLHIVEGEFNIDYFEFEALTITGYAAKAANSASIFPIPAREKITIKQVQKNFDNAVIMDVTGNVIQRNVLNSAEETISVENLHPGMYIIQLNGNDKSELFRVLIK